MSTRNQFFYTAKRMLEPKKGDTEPKFVDRTDSFNIEEILRTLEEDDGRLSVYLKDGHEESRTIGHLKPKTKDGLPTPIKERQYVISQIVLEGEDIARFRQWSNIEQ